MMNFPLDASTLMLQLQGFFWPFLRLSALLLAAPMFSASSVPVRFRILLAVVVAGLIAPLIPVPALVDPFSADGVLLMAREVLIGVAMGFVLQLVFGAIVVAGETLAMSMGLGFAMSIDPQNGVQVPVISQFSLVIATLLFFAIDGHLLLFTAFVDSFQVLPVGSPLFSMDMLSRVALLGSTLFASALVLALPALTAVLMTNIAFGVITRSAPQLNIFAVGFPVTILVGFVFLFLGLPTFINSVRGLLEAAFTQTLLVL
jgi:flagellar biosynthesis protein FliR